VHSLTIGGEALPPAPARRPRPQTTRCAASNRTLRRARALRGCAVPPWRPRRVAHGRGERRLTQPARHGGL